MFLSAFNRTPGPPPFSSINSTPATTMIPPTLPAASRFRNSYTAGHEPISSSPYETGIVTNRRAAKPGGSETPKVSWNVDNGPNSGRNCFADWR